MKKVLLLLVLVLVFYLGTEIFSKKTSDEEPLPQTISVEEMSRFLPVWSEYITGNAGKKELSKISLGTGNISGKTRKWLAERNWSAERFFYVEQRMESIVKSAYLRDHAQANIELLRKQLRAEEQEYIRYKTEEGRKILFDIEQRIDAQKKNLNVENVTEAEMEMVDKNIAYIKDILEGKKRF